MLAASKGRETFFARMRPDVLGAYLAWQDKSRFSQLVYSESEAAAQVGERRRESSLLPRTSNGSSTFRSHGGPAREDRSVSAFQRAQGLAPHTYSSATRTPFQNATRSYPGGAVFGLG